MPEQIVAPPVVPFAQISKWLASVEAGAWTWTKNTRCKYVEILFDTRRGAYRIIDRDGEPLTFDQLQWQYSKETPVPPMEPKP